MSKTTLNRRGAAAATPKELEMLKKSVYYDKENGIFYRITTGKPVTINWPSKQAAIHVQRSSMVKSFTAWRVAVFLSSGVYPSFEDAVGFKDDNNKNFKIDNIVVVPRGDDEQTLAEFATEHDLPLHVVNKRMKDCPRIKRTKRTGWFYFYKKSDFIKRCSDLLGEELEEIITERVDDEFIRVKPFKAAEELRGNKLIREFLKQHTIIPTRWEMTLCR